MQRLEYNNLPCAQLCIAMLLTYQDAGTTSAKSSAAAAGNLRGLVRQLSIDQFENEGRRVSMGTNSVEKPQRTPLFERHNSDPGVHKAIIRSLASSKNSRAAVPDADAMPLLPGHDPMFHCHMLLQQFYSV